MRLLIDDDDVGRSGARRAVAADGAHREVGLHGHPRGEHGVAVPSRRGEEQARAAAGGVVDHDRAFIGVSAES